MNGAPALPPPIPPGALDGLRDIHLPPPVSWWPPAPGWWLSLLLVIVAIAALLWWWRSTRLKRAALRELKQLHADHADDPAAYAAQLSILLRRCAVSRFPREAAAGCIGEAWLQFLDQSGATTDFTSGAGRALATAPYRRDESIEVEALERAVERWIRKAMGGHRRV